MMRSGPTEPEGTAQPLGPPVRSAEESAGEALVPLPGSPGIEINMGTGKWRTNISTPIDIVVGIPP